MYIKILDLPQGVRTGTARPPRPGQTSVFGCDILKYDIWKLADTEEQAAAALRLDGVSPLVAEVLASRGYSSPEEARAFLTSAQAPLPDPAALPDMAQATRRIRQAIEHREKIAVYGDYDVDGITATCLLTDYLRRRGGDVVMHIPGRIEEGYGLNAPAIHTLHGQGVGLIVTVDCGITAVEEARLCRDLGVDLIITDHHTCREDLPEAVAVVNPQRPDSEYPFSQLAGVGVAFKLAASLAGDQAAVFEDYCDLVCLGTVADVMPLLGENRAFVTRGIQRLNASQRPGLRQLIKDCNITAVTSTSIGYVLSPRINAAGRLGRVELATELILTEDRARAMQLSAQLCALNRQRQSIESDIYADAKAMLAAQPQKDVIVLAGEQWHQGVVGIVASRLAEEFGCPTLLICLDGDKGKASSRSYGGFNLFAALQASADLLESFGGHELAAGFTVRRENVDAFRRAISAKADAYRQTGDSQAALTVDCAVEPELLTVENIDALRQLEPCGCGCPSPVLCLKGVLLEQLSEISGGKHLRLRLRYGQGNGEVLGGVFFSTTQRQAAVAPGDRVDVAFTPQVNEYRGFRNTQLNLIDIRSSEPMPNREGQQELYDRFARGEVITPAEADRLLPVRAEFVEVWRYLSANAREGELQEEFSCLNRRLRRKSGMEIPGMRTRICLDVFQELGLITLIPSCSYYSIRLTGRDKKVDLDHSRLIRRLKSIKQAGKE